MTEQNSETGWHLAFLACLYILTRYTHLLLLPIFNDEAIYIRWATIIHEDPTKLFVSAMDGKAPLFMWINSLTLSFFNDILFSGRIISVIAGICTMTAVYFIGKRLYSETVGYFASLIYLLLPFSLLHDRLALVDSLVTAFATGIILVSINLTRDPRKVYSRSIVLGTVMGLGFLTKTPALVFFIYPVIAIFLFSDYKQARLWKGLVLAYAVALIFMAPYLLHEPPRRVFGTDKVFHNARILQTIVSTVKLQNTGLAGNIKEWADYLWTYVTWPLLLVFLGSILQGIKSHDARKVYLMSWFLLPSLATILLTKEHYSRYFLFCIPPVALMAAHTLSGFLDIARERSKLLFEMLRLEISAMILLLLPSLSLDFNIVYAPDKAGMAKKDHWQYTDSEYSGYGIPEAVEFLSMVAGEKTVFVFFSPTWGSPADSLYLYLKDRPNIRMYEAWWASMMPIFPANVASMPVYKSHYQKETASELQMTDLEDREVFFIARDHDFNPGKLVSENPNLQRVKSFKKLEKDFSFSIYRMNPAKKVYMTQNPS